MNSLLVLGSHATTSNKWYIPVVRADVVDASCFLNFVKYLIDILIQLEVSIAHNASPSTRVIMVLAMSTA